MLYLEKWAIKKKREGGEDNINSAFFNAWLCNGDVTWLKDILNYFENSENTEIIPYGICDSLLDHSFSSEAAAIDTLPETVGRIQNMHLIISVTGGASQLHHIQSNFCLHPDAHDPIPVSPILLTSFVLISCSGLTTTVKLHPVLPTFDNCLSCCILKSTAHKEQKEN